MNQNKQSHAGDVQNGTRIYWAECAFEYFVSLMVTDSFLAILLSYIGMSEAMIGIVSSIISLAFLFELPSMLIAHKIRNVKRFCIIFHAIGELFFLSMYVIPLFDVFAPVRAPLTVICIVVAYFGNYFVTSMIYKWGNSFIERDRRALAGATKEMISLISGIVVTVLVGFVLKNFQDTDDMRGWFIFAAVAMSVFSVCDCLCLYFMTRSRNRLEDDENRLPADGGRRTYNGSPVTFSTVLSQTVGRRGYRRSVAVQCLWSASVHLTIGFMGSYKNALFSIVAVQIINNAGSLIRVAFSRPLGKYSDKHSYAKGITLGLIIAIAAFTANVFTSESTRWLLPVYVALYAVSIGGTSQNFFLSSYDFVESDFVVQAMAVKSSLAGICGFAASLVGGAILDTVQKNGNMLFGITANGQQFLSALTVIGLIITLLFNKLFVEGTEIRREQ